MNESQGEMTTMKSFQNAEFNQLNYIPTRDLMGNQKGRWDTQHL